jgi:4-amino-4-deoxy-L-arabinose transferase-like glycosyltransferase
VIPALAGALMIVLGALIARELGGDRRAQIFAAFVMIVVPAFVGMDAALNTVSLETPAFMLVAYVFARLVRTGDQRLYVALGAAAGLAVLVKFTMLAYLLGIGVAIVATPRRRDLRGPWLWTGTAVAAVIVAPSIVWQFAHGLPVLEFVSNQGGGGAVLGLRGRAGYVVSLVLLPGPLALLVTIPGVRRLAADRTVRPVGVAVGTALVVLFLASGKGYYAFPGIAVVCCAGAITLSGWTPRARRNAVIALIVNLAIPLVLLVSLVPTSWLRNEDFAQATELSERIGWREFAQQIGEITSALPPDDRARAVVIGANYTLPSAIEFYRDTYPVPAVAVSGHNSAYLWWPELPDGYVAIAVGFERRELVRLFGDVRHVGTVTNRERVHGYDWGDDISVCREPKLSAEDLREALKKFTA